MKKTIIGLFAALCLIAIASFPANADIVKLNFTGSVTTATGIFSDEIGDVSGALFVDTQTPSILQYFGGSDEQLTSTEATSPSHVWMEIQFGLEAFTTANNSNGGGTSLKFLHQDNLLGADDSFSYTQGLAVQGDHFASWNIDAENLFALPLPSTFTFNLLDSVDLTAVQNSILLGMLVRSSGVFQARNDTGQVLGGVGWDFTSLNAENVTVVPLPTPLLLLCSALAGLGWFRRII